MVIFLYKTIDIIITAYKEYRALDTYENKKRTKAKVVQEIIMQLSSILIFSLDTKKLTYSKVMKPLTKLVLLTYNGSRNDLMKTAIKMSHFIMSLKTRFVERFKL